MFNMYMGFMECFLLMVINNYDHHNYSGILIVIKCGNESWKNLHFTGKRVNINPKCKFTEKSVIYKKKDVNFTEKVFVQKKYVKFTGKVKYLRKTCAK